MRERVICESSYFSAQTMYITAQYACRTDIAFGLELSRYNVVHLHFRFVDNNSWERINKYFYLWPSDLKRLPLQHPTFIFRSGIRTVPSAGGANHGKNVKEVNFSFKSQKLLSVPGKCLQDLIFPRQGREPRCWLL